MENNTGFSVGDHVVITGGFEDGIVGEVSDIDLSGEVKPWPRFTVQASERRGGKIGGLKAINLEPLTAVWTDDTGFWEDGVPSWAAQVEARQWGPTKTDIAVPCTIRIRQESPDSFWWRATRDGSGSVVDSGTSTTLAWAQVHALKAVVWHGAKEAT